MALSRAARRAVAAQRKAEKLDRMAARAIVERNLNNRKIVEANRATRKQDAFDLKVSKAFGGARLGDAPGQSHRGYVAGQCRLPSLSVPVKQGDAQVAKLVDRSQWPVINKP